MPSPALGSPPWLPFWGAPGLSQVSGLSGRVYTCSLWVSSMSTVSSRKAELVLRPRPHWLPAGVLAYWKDPPACISVLNGVVALGSDGCLRRSSRSKGSCHFPWRVSCLSCHQTLSSFPAGTEVTPGVTRPSTERQPLVVGRSQPLGMVARFQLEDAQWAQVTILAAAGFLLVPAPALPAAQFHTRERSLAPPARPQPLEPAPAAQVSRTIFHTLILEPHPLFLTEHLILEVGMVTGITSEYVVNHCLRPEGLPRVSQSY